MLFCGVVTYLDESVSAFVLDVESGKFDNNRDKQHTRHLVSIKVVHFRVTPYSYGCGVLFICYWAFQSLTSDKLNDSTLSFCVKSLWSQETNVIK